MDCRKIKIGKGEEREGKRKGKREREGGGNIAGDAQFRYNIMIA